ncbi:anhydro-N-acetylmuramic acid kinase [Neptuniibacter sp. QD34_54]|uniref:anhydro-N-acetylmuramic acid kinase n=1 Tax=Neptuniibacter sp. QD34_54 TaxID=3398208 RepID=UPI0039F642A1
MSQKDLFIGLMSGTSLDGIDAVAVRLTPNFEMVATHAEEIPATLKNDILTLTQPGDLEIDLMGKVDRSLGKLFAKTVNNLLSKNGLSAEQVSAIGSHGQTIRHRPEFGFTLQIGDANQIAELTGITTVADFRRRDMAANGQGAPLVPAFHNAMLHSHDCNRILLNIGGMANLTFLPKSEEQNILGFDTGPGNVLLDAWIKHCRDLPFDQNGKWALSGSINEDLLEQLSSIEYFSEPPPKSTGREQFNLAWLKQTLSTLPAIKAEDVQRTLLELTATSITDAIKTHIPSQVFELYICGGGSFNQALTQRISDLLPNIKVSNSDDIGIDADWMEAAAFAWLAMRCLDGKAGNNPNVTGAKGDRILGAIYQA